MKIALIYAGTGNPVRDAASGLDMPPLGLPLLAALTPNGAQVTVLDDSRRQVNVEERYDLIGISALTPTAHRAYALASEFRRRGAKVVLGGIHVTTLPDEAAEHADAVALGEADETWPTLVSDFTAGRLKPRYEASRPVDLAGSPQPRWESLAANPYYPVRVIETTRGCPHRCDFCVVPRHFGQAFRHRPLEEIETELRDYFPRVHPFFNGAKRWFRKGSNVPYFAAKRLLYVLDNNVIGDRRYARELFALLREMDIRWSGHAPITIARDPELLRLCAESGCHALNIGFESLDQEALDSMGKPFNRAADFERSIAEIHHHGIGIFGTFVIGLESDTPTMFERIVGFVERTRLDVAFPLILAPLPGTDLFARYRDEGRLIDRDWRNYDSGSVVFRPLHIGTRELYEGQRWMFDRLFSAGSIRRRILRSPRVQPLFFANLNWQFRRKVRNIHRGWSAPPALPPWSMR